LYEQQRQMWRTLAGAWPGGAVSSQAGELHVPAGRTGARPAGKLGFFGSKGANPPAGN